MPITRDRRSSDGATGKIERRFSDREIALALEFKRMKLPWEPAVGQYVYDAGGAVKPSSPFQQGVYFLLNYDCFMERLGGVARFKDLMAWLPTWSDAREILRRLGVSNEVVREALARTAAIESGEERVVLYELIAARLVLRQSPS